jgi:hypothetical protein
MAMVTQQAPHQPEEPDASQVPPIGLLIEHEREISKLSESKRERADALSAAQITAATALGAILVTAAKSLPEDQVPKTAAWGVLFALALTILSAVVTRATIVSLLLRPNSRKVRAEHNMAKADFRAMRDRATNTGDCPGTISVQRAILRVWTTRTDVNQDALRWKHLGGAVSGALLLVAVAMLGWMAVSVLENVW